MVVLEVMGAIAMILYIGFGWWAANRTVFWNTAIFGEWNTVILFKFVVAFFLGWILIPIAVVLKAQGKR